MRRAVFAAALVLATAAAAQTHTGSWELGLGHESISAPLIRIDDDSPVVRIAGIDRLSGAHVAGSASTLVDRPLAGGVVALAGRVEVKRAPSAPTLDFGAASLDLMQRWTLPGLTVGLGPSVQHFWVAGRPFRRTLGLQAELTLADAQDGHTAWFASLARQRHGRGFEDLDALASGLSVQHHVPSPWPWLSALDVELGIGRDRNRRGQPDLGSRQHQVRLSAEFRHWGVQWSMGGYLQHARFDAPGFDGLPARRDRFQSLDLGAAVDLDSGRLVRLAWTLARNRANVSAFDSRQRQLSLTLGSRS